MRGLGLKLIPRQTHGRGSCGCHGDSRRDRDGGKAWVELLGVGVKLKLPHGTGKLERGERREERGERREERDCPV